MDSGFHLSFHDGAGNVIRTVPLPDRPRAIRFAVGDHKRRSTIWRVWAQGSEVYLAIRNLGHVQKVSLHSSGEWHIAWADDETAAEYSDSTTRFIEQWTAPEADQGWRRAFILRVPSGSLSAIEGEADDNKVLWLPDAEKGHATCVGIAIVEPDKGLETDRVVPFAGFRMADGRAVILVHWTQTYEESGWAQVAEALKAVPMDSESRFEDAKKAVDRGDFRVGVHAHTETGIRVLWDVAVGGIDRN